MQKLNSIQNGSQSTLNQLQSEPLPMDAHFAVKQYAYTLRTVTITIMNINFYRLYLYYNLHPY